MHVKGNVDIQYTALKLAEVKCGPQTFCCPDAMAPDTVWFGTTQS